MIHMSGYQEKQAFMNTYSPIRESSREGSAGAAAAAGGVYYEDDDDDAVAPSWCGCFRLCGFGSGDGEARNLIGGGEEKRESWLGGKLKKLKEFSEVVAGPKWKNMLRKMGKYCNPKKGKTTATAFQYDAESYALNFSDGMPPEEEDHDGLLRNFSTRFAAPGQRTGGL